MEREAGSPLPGQFPSRPGQVFPLFHVLGAVGEFAGGEVIVTRSTDPLRVESIALARADSTCLWLANLTASHQTASVTGFSRVTHRLDLDWPQEDGWMFEPDTVLLSKGQALGSVSGHEIQVGLAAFGLVRLEFQS
jgi:hypothetical protein